MAQNWFDELVSSDGLLVLFEVMLRGRALLALLFADLPLPLPLPFSVELAAVIAVTREGTTIENEGVVGLSFEAGLGCCWVFFSVIAKKSAKNS